MHRIVARGVCAAAMMLLCAGSAAAWHLQGRILCEGNGTPMEGVQVIVENDGGNYFSDDGWSDADGYYVVYLPEQPGCFHATVQVKAGETAVTPPGGVYEFCTSESDFELTRDFVIASPTCESGYCWLTGGGAKYSPITNTQLGQANKTNNFGGNVYPSCSSEPGQGGQWNNIADDLRLHFQGFIIHVLRCGNVEGIEPGSESPVTSYNFIEFEGTGRLKGIKGNKADYGTVSFFARCEDRNEPGSHGQRDGALKDRYFLNVFTNPADPVGSSVVLVDEDGNPATVDPLTITDGNLQIHDSSCGPGVVSMTAGPTPPTARLAPVDDGQAVPTALWFAPPRPSPAGSGTMLRFALPHAAAITLTVFDVAGRAVRTLAAGTAAAGTHAIAWDLRDGAGRRVEGGMYFLRLRVNGQVLHQRIAVLN